MGLRSVDGAFPKCSKPELDPVRLAAGSPVILVPAVAGNVAGNVNVDSR